MLLCNTFTIKSLTKDRDSPPKRNTLTTTTNTMALFVDSSLCLLEQNNFLFEKNVVNSIKQHISIPVDEPCKKATESDPVETIQKHDTRTVNHENRLDKMECFVLINIITKENVDKKTPTLFLDPNNHSALSIEEEALLTKIPFGKNSIVAKFKKIYK